MSDIYSQENIARSRARAATIRADVASGERDKSWLDTADEVEAYADEREKVRLSRLVDESGHQVLPDVQEPHGTVSAWQAWSAISADQRTKSEPHAALAGALRVEILEGQ